MNLLAIDPGPVESAWLFWENDRPTKSRKVRNDIFVSQLSALGAPSDGVFIEMIASYGMPVGAEVFETCVWIGRFMEAAGSARVRRIFRKDVKMHLCGQTKAKDGNIRQALIDRFGGKEKAIGKKKTPGPLYGISGDVWAALAVAVTAYDQAKPS